ncbi:hypothetical protein [Desulfallas thermosapovorans]|uniref:Uncharacterized protein n=1 Tax=Desulfallas thermosapovorans DSM 6562 TaxID=1121431 RepID=A0A5S4ZR96_9FIRM|nr:hypothetical protein [Desulfallas thermosapovorans]TYO95143.1 hypothetical protein LX24_01872 [Desulfallas thermosapovorans DSM 6562]
MGLDNYTRCQLGEPHTDEDLESANGPVVTYHLSPEEIAKRYGPPQKMQRKSRKPKLDKKSLADMLRRETVGIVARKNMIPKRQLLIMCEKYGLKLDKKGRLKEDKNVDIQSNDNTQTTNGGFKTYPEDAGRKKTRLEVAREKLSKEKYLKLKGEDLKDKEIMEQFDIPNDVFYVLKKEWGLTGDKAGETTVTKMTIAKAIKLREETQNEVSYAEKVISPDIKQVAPKLAKLLFDHLEEHSAKLSHIDKVFDTVEIEV